MSYRYIEQGYQPRCKLRECNIIRSVHNMLKCQEGLQIFHLMFATSTTNMTTWYVPTLWLAEKSIFSRIVPALMPQHTENITRTIEHIKHILCATINTRNTRGTPFFLLGGVPFCLEYNISNTIYYDVMTPADRSASHIMHPIWPYHLSPAIHVHASEHVRIIEKPP